MSSIEKTQNRFKTNRVVTFPNPNIFSDEDFLPAVIMDSILDETTQYVKDISDIPSNKSEI